MEILFTIVGIILLLAGGTGIILTSINYPVGILDWVEGILTFGVFTILGIAAIVILTVTPRET